MKAEFHGCEERGGLYSIRNRVIDFVYLGSTHGFQTRYEDHVYQLLRGKHKNRRLQEDFDFFGPEAFQFEVVALEDDEGRRLQLEKQAIRLLFGASCYNQVIAGPPSQKGRVRSPESRRKMSESHLGVGHSDKTKKKMSATRQGWIPDGLRATIGKVWTGRKHSEASKTKIAAARTGTTLSEETKKKIGLSATGRTHTEESKAKMRAIAKARAESRAA